MADIRIDFQGQLTDGQVVTFKAPCNCSTVDKLKVYYRQGEELASKVFTMKDTLGNTLTGIGNLFATGSYVQAILDTTNNYAYLQNACNNGFIASQLGKQIKGYDTENGVDISAYNKMSNKYTVPADGVICVSVTANGTTLQSVRVVSTTFKTDGSKIGNLDIGYVTNTGISNVFYPGYGLFPVYKNQQIYYNSTCTDGGLEKIYFYPYYYG